MGERQLLSIEGLSVRVENGNENDFNILKDVSFAIPERGVVGLLGESGSGKSIMSKEILGLNTAPVKKTAGGIIFKGKELLSPKDHADIRGKGVSMIFQHPASALNPVFTIGHQLIETIRLHNPELSKKEVGQRAIELLAQTGINYPEERINAYPHQFSGGMNQRVMIAMALATEPELIIADEPTTALDVITQEQIIRLLLALGDKKNFAILFITHDLSLMQKVADTVIVLYAGEIMEIISSQALRNGHIKHPCTDALMRSVPKMYGEKDALYSIPGQTAKNTTRYDKSCIFHERCPKSKEKCATEKPLLKDCVKCFYPKGSE